MEKAYDTKALLEILKGQGLEVAEESAKIIINSLFIWIEDSAKLSETPYDDMALVILPQLKTLALSKAEDINPEDNVEG